MKGHYNFRQHLFLKGKEYGCEVTEEYTSKCCTSCGIISETYKKRKKICTNCSYNIDRDINGSRNILLKNGTEIISVKAKSRNNKYINDKFM